MFEWLVKMLIHTPVGSSGCACCEGRRRQLEKMRREITGENEPATAEKSADEQNGYGQNYPFGCAIDVDNVGYGKKRD